jgi:hypothetical protein
MKIHCGKCLGVFTTVKDWAEHPCAVAAGVNVPTPPEGRMT